MTSDTLREKTNDELIDLMVTTVNEMLLFYKEREHFRQKAKRVQQIQRIA